MRAEITGVVRTPYALSEVPLWAVAAAATPAAAAAACAGCVFDAETNLPALRVAGVDVPLEVPEMAVGVAEFPVPKCIRYDVVQWSEPDEVVVAVEGLLRLSALALSGRVCVAGAGRACTGGRVLPPTLPSPVPRYSSRSLDVCFLPAGYVPPRETFSLPSAAGTAGALTGCGCPEGRVGPADLGLAYPVETGSETTLLTKVTFLSVCAGLNGCAFFLLMSTSSADG